MNMTKQPEFNWINKNEMLTATIVERIAKFQI